jgi:hypothetical protein
LGLLWVPAGSDRLLDIGLPNAAKAQASPPAVMARCLEAWGAAVNALCAAPSAGRQAQRRTGGDAAVAAAQRLVGDARYAEDEVDRALEAAAEAAAAFSTSQEPAAAGYSRAAQQGPVEAAAGRSSGGREQVVRSDSDATTAGAAAAGGSSAGGVAARQPPRQYAAAQHAHAGPAGGIQQQPLDSKAAVTSQQVMKAAAAQGSPISEPAAQAVGRSQAAARSAMARLSMRRAPAPA